MSVAGQKQDSWTNTNPTLKAWDAQLFPLPCICSTVDSIRSFLKLNSGDWTLTRHSLTDLVWWRWHPSIMIILFNSLVCLLRKKISLVLMPWFVCMFMEVSCESDTCWHYLALNQCRRCWMGLRGRSMLGAEVTGIADGFVMASVCSCHVNIKPASPQQHGGHCTGGWQGWLGFDFWMLWFSPPTSAHSLLENSNTSIARGQQQ